ncbi:MAG: hypothetical protein ACKO68_00305, partial [Bacteroidota bacterium]
TEGHPPKLVLGSCPKQLVQEAGVTEFPVTFVNEPLTGFWANSLTVEIPNNREQTRYFFNVFNG